MGSGTAAIFAICDTMIPLNFIDTGDCIDREMTVIKSRGTRHSRMHENFQISDNRVLFFPNTTAQGGR
jgi:hypothetical protein